MLDIFFKCLKQTIIASFIVVLLSVIFSIGVNSHALLKQAIFFFCLTFFYQACRK